MRRRFLWRTQECTECRIVTTTFTKQQVFNDATGIRLRHPYTSDSSKKNLLKLIKLGFFESKTFSSLSLQFNFSYQYYTDNARCAQNNQSRRQKERKVSEALSLLRLTRAKTHGGLLEEQGKCFLFHLKSSFHSQDI